MLFDKEQTVDLGGVRVRMMAMGANHTRGDTAFWIEPDGILVSGDVVMSTMPASTARSRSSPRGSRVSIDSSSSHRNGSFRVTGRWGGTEMITRWKTLLTTVQARAAALKKQGKSIDETVTAIQDELQDRYPRNGLAGAARAAYNEAS